MSRTLKLSAAALLMTGGLTAVTASPAAAASCYDSYNYYTTEAYNIYPGGTLWLTTTPNCVDINVRPNSTVSVQTCFSSGGSYWCNDVRRITGGTWGAAATNVNDGVRFYLKFSAPSNGRYAA